MGRGKCVCCQRLSPGCLPPALFGAWRVKKVNETHRVYWSGVCGIRVCGRQGKQGGLDCRTVVSLI